MTYSEDLRKRAVEYVESGNLQKDAAKVFGVTSRTIWNWIQKKKNEGSLKPTGCYKGAPKKVDDDLLLNFIEKNPDAYLREIAKEFNVDPSTIFYACKRLGVTLKKRQRLTKSVVRKKEKSSLRS